MPTDTHTARADRPAARMRMRALSLSRLRPCSCLDLSHMLGARDVQSPCACDLPTQRGLRCGDRCLVEAGGALAISLPRSPAPDRPICTRARTLSVAHGDGLRYAGWCLGCRRPSCERACGSWASRICICRARYAAPESDRSHREELLQKTVARPACLLGRRLCRLLRVEAAVDHLASHRIT